MYVVADTEGSLISSHLSDGDEGYGRLAVWCLYGLVYVDIDRQLAVVRVHISPSLLGDVGVLLG